MDFLKSAVASAMAQGSAFPYSFGDRVDLDDSIWTLYNGTRRQDGSSCSIFSFDIAANKSHLPLAKNALKKLRTMRHPGVIKVLDTMESDSSHIYIATEPLVPLRWHVKRKSLSPETIKWGLYSVASTLKFINEDASSIHGNLKVASVYTSESGEWKLGGFEVLSSVKDDEAIIYTFGSLVPDSARYAPPELARSGWEAIKRGPHSAVDSFNFGTLMYEVFNGDFASSDQAGQTKGIPPSMHAPYKRLVNANPKARLSIAHLLEQGKRRGAFFDTPLIKLTEGVDNLGVKTESEKEAFLSDLDSLTDDFPEEFFKMKILPELIKSVEFGGGGPKAFGVVMKIAGKLSNEDFDAKITPVIIRLFGNQDRAIRVCLLDSLPTIIDRLTQKTVNDKIFPQLVTGFTDLAPLLREQTLKSVLTIVTKLSDRTINGELLRHLAKTANDEQPGIRTNTTICLGKIAKHLGTSNRSKVLVAAFTRSLRDPFVHARNAALMALAATVDFFPDEDCACRVMPVVCPLLIDKEKMVRDQASRTLEVFMQKTKKAAEDMPDSVLPLPQKETSGGPTAGNAGVPPRMGTPQPGVASDAAGWAGWAISSFTNKLSAAAGQMESGGEAAGAGPGAAAGPTAGGPVAALKRPLPASAPVTRPGSSSTSSASALHRQAVKSPLPRTADSFLRPDDSGANDNDGWGDMDDIDDGFGGFGDDDGTDAWGDGGYVTPTGISAPVATSTKSSPGNTKKAPTKVPNPGALYGNANDEEPDFAGWLAEQAQKKKGTAAGAGGKGKVLPKGLNTTSLKGSGTAGKKVGVGGKKTVGAGKKKVVDLKPKDDGGDDDGWGDGW